MAWPISTAKASGLFEPVIVSTDDTEIAEVARSCGAAVPFTRPAELSDDFTSTTDVIAHAVRWAIAQGWSLSAVCCIYATAPMVDAEDLAAGGAALMKGNWAYTFSVTDFASTIFRSLALNPDGSVEMLFPDKFNSRSQDLPSAYHDAAQFYWGRPRSWLNGLKMFAPHSLAVPVPRWRVQDIDDLDDWKRAELLFQAGRVAAPQAACPLP
jgi:N-acylneuraminate cytidylyltransferase